MTSTREDILHAAVRLFSEKGFDNTTVRDICSEAGVNVAAVNYHFKGKAGLGEAVLSYLFERTDEIRGFLDKAVSVKNSSEWETSIRNFIYNFISDRDSAGEKNFYRSRLIFLELNYPSELFDMMYAQYLKPMQQTLKQLIRMGLPEDATEETVSMWLTTLMSQCVIFRKKSTPSMEVAEIDFTDPANVEMVTEHIASTIFSGLEFRGTDRTD